MTNWKLIVDNYGKISHAEIEMGSLMLLVGDNNSGKSYLTALLWGMYNLGVDFFLDDMEKNLTNEEQTFLLKWLTEKLGLVKSEGSVTAVLGKTGDILICVLNRGLSKKKDQFVKYIFNSDDITIGSLRIEAGEVEKIKVQFSLESDYVYVKLGIDGQSINVVSLSSDVTKMLLANDSGDKKYSLHCYG